MSQETQNSLLDIQKVYMSMSETEKKIADYILNNPEKTVHSTTKFLASEVGVSEGSIINFANQLGYGGFTKLKINIAENLHNRSTLTFENIGQSDRPKDALRKMIDNAVSSFETTYSILSSSDLEKAAELLMSAKKKIDIYGVGTSSMIAMDAYYRFMRIGLPVYAVTDSHICSVSASLLCNECVALGISYTGRTIETVRAMEIAKANGAKTIGITSFSGSALAKLCDVTILIASKEAEINKEAVVSRLTQLLVLDSLCAYISYQRRDETIARIESLVNIIGEHRHMG